MALKTVYLYPDPGSFTSPNPLANQEAVCVDDGDATWAEGVGDIQCRFLTGDVPAGVSLKYVEMQVRFDGQFDCYDMEVFPDLYAVESQAGEPFTTYSIGVNRKLQGALDRSAIERAHLVASYDRPSRVSFFRLAVTYDDGQPEPEPEPKPNPATVTITDTEHAHDGEPHGVTVTTDPPGLSYRLTYDGSPEEPSAPGHYAALAVITDPAYTGQAAAVLSILAPEPDPDPPRERAEITITDTTQDADGTPRPVTVTTDPPDLPVRVLYDGAEEPPTEPGVYGVLASVWTETHWGRAAAALRVVQPPPVPVEVTIGDTQQVEGETRPVTVTTDPPGVPVTVLYDGALTRPTTPGHYAVLATVTAPGYVGQGMAVLSIAPAPASEPLINPVLVLETRHFKIGDTSLLRARITHGDGRPADLTGRSIMVTISPGPDRTKLVHRAAVVTAPKAGEIDLPLESGDFVRPGPLFVEARIDDAQTVPAKDAEKITIHKRL